MEVTMFYTKKGLLALSISVMLATGSYLFSMSQENNVSEKNDDNVTVTLETETSLENQQTTDVEEKLQTRKRKRDTKEESEEKKAYKKRRRETVESSEEESLEQVSQQEKIDNTEESNGGIKKIIAKIKEFYSNLKKNLDEWNKKRNYNKDVRKKLSKYPIGVGQFAQNPIDSDSGIKDVSEIQSLFWWLLPNVAAIQNATTLAFLVNIPGKETDSQSLLEDLFSVDSVHMLYNSTSIARAMEQFFKENFDIAIYYGNSKANMYGALKVTLKDGLLYMLPTNKVEIKETLEEFLSYIESNKNFSYIKCAADVVLLAHSLNDGYIDKVLPLEECDEESVRAMTKLIKEFFAKNFKVSIHEKQV